MVDGALTAAAGSWEPAPDAVTFQWLADGVPIEGAVGEQLTPGVGLVGSALSVRVTASRSGYTDVSVTSAATDPVTQAKFTDVTDAVLSGTPRLGETLRLAAGSTAPEASPTIAWQRDGETIADASGTSYVLTADDLGTRISALVRWDRPGYVPAEAPTLRTSRVKATPTLDVRVRTGARGAVRIRADVAVPDGASLPAQVFVRSGRTRQPVPLVDGTAVTVLTGLRPGTRTLRVVLPPTHTVAAAVWSGEVTIP